MQAAECDDRRLLMCWRRLVYHGRPKGLDSCDKQGVNSATDTLSPIAVLLILRLPVSQIARYLWALSESPVNASREGGGAP